MTKSKLLRRADAQKNILRDPWIPQKELLNHPKTSILFTHGGYNSLIEAIDAQVPLLASPLKATDQISNCEYIERRIIGRCLRTMTT